jgi:hypothetical protein
MFQGDVTKGGEGHRLESVRIGPVAYVYHEPGSEAAPSVRRQHVDVFEMCRCGVDQLHMRNTNRRVVR